MFQINRFLGTFWASQIVVFVPTIRTCQDLKYLEMFGFSLTDHENKIEKVINGNSNSWNVIFFFLNCRIMKHYRQRKHFPLCWMVKLSIVRKKEKLAGKTFLIPYLFFLCVFHKSIPLRANSFISSWAHSWNKNIFCLTKALWKEGRRKSLQEKFFHLYFYQFLSILWDIGRSSVDSNLSSNITFGLLNKVGSLGKVFWSRENEMRIDGFFRSVFQQVDLSQDLSYPPLNLLI